MSWTGHEELRMDAEAEAAQNHVPVHERIAAAVAETRRGSTGASTDVRNFMLAACDHADKVLARHGGGVVSFGRSETPWCNVCQTTAPCPDVHDLAAFWLGEGWDQ